MSWDWEILFGVVWLWVMAFFAWQVVLWMIRSAGKAWRNER